MFIQHKSAPDPFSVFIDPPPNESPAEKVAREAREAEEKRVSDEIDEGIRKERVKRKRDVIRVLLVGQAESGKSTTLKSWCPLRFRICSFTLTGFADFHLRFSHKQWKAERIFWRPVIQVNLIQAVHTILEALQNELSSTAVPIDDDDSAPSPSSKQSIILTDQHRLLKHRLTPLGRIETDLKRRLGAAVDEDDGTGAREMYATPFDEPVPAPNPVVGTSFRRRRIGAGAGEVVVKSWKAVIHADGEGVPPPTDPLSSRGTRANQALEPPESGTLDEATETIASCRDDIKALWEDPLVQRVLMKHKVKISDSAEL
jgi:guanine nucleotide-binding protein subunit alpha